MYEVINKFRISKLNKYYHYIHKSDYVFLGHRHSELELNIILSGSMEITCGDSVFKAEKGNMVLIPPGVFHQNRVTDKECAEMIVIQFEMVDALLGRSFSVFSLTSDTENLLRIFCKEIENNFVTGVNGDLICITDASKKLFEVFLQYSVGHEEKIYTQRDENSAIYNTAVKFMLDNVSEKLLISDIARRCGVCTTTLKNIFSYYTGRGCMTYFNELKLDMAKALLAEGKSCADVSAVLGFSSQAYFTKRFKLFYNILPSQVKKL